MIYRVKQFFWGLTARVSREDIALVNRLLDERERELFYRLPRNEQVHSIKVARQVIQETSNLGIRDSSLIKAAFLHDIGKIDSGLNIFSKSIIVLLNKMSPRFLSRFIKLRAVYTYFNHPELAIGYLESGDEKLNYYILNHHNYGITGDKALKIIQEADSKS